MADFVLANDGDYGDVAIKLGISALKRLLNRSGTYQSIQIGGEVNTDLHFLCRFLVALPSPCEAFNHYTTYCVFKRAGKNKHLDPRVVKVYEGNPSSAEVIGKHVKPVATFTVEQRKVSVLQLGRLRKAEQVSTAD